jgi:glyoxylase-like metal-dependent hydrolase (beta-lactamase superfamily II)
MDWASTPGPLADDLKMRIHHLNCGTFCPFGGAYMDGFSQGASGHLVCHCLLIETDRGLVLIDTGIGLRDVDHPHPRLSALYTDVLLRVQFERENTARWQIEQLGFAADDVRHIVLTHLDFDHAGGLEDFPNATVHVMARELEAAMHPHGFVAQRRYRQRQWDEVQHWERYEPAGERWQGFECVRDLRGLPPEILLVPLYGHTHGHAGIAIDTQDGWLLHCGDAYFYRGEIHGRDYLCPVGLRGYQKLMEVDRRSRLHNQARLRALAASAPDVTLFCAHDAIEFEELAGLDGAQHSAVRGVSEQATALHPS